MMPVPRSRSFVRAACLLALGAVGCSENAGPENLRDPNNKAEDPPDTDEPSDTFPHDLHPSDDPLHIDSFSGLPIDGCENTGWNAATATLTLTLSGDTAVLSAPTNKVAVNSVVCVGTIGGVADTPLSTTAVAKIVVTGTSGDDEVIVDLAPGSFGTKIFSAVGGITLNLGDGADKVSISGTSAVNNFKVAKSSLNTDILFELSGDKIADIKAVHLGTVSTILSLGAGADIATASPLATDINRFAGTTLAAAPLHSPLIVYGGSENDTITGGLGDDILSGGAGDDVFKMSKVSDGADTYKGDAGIDFVDYSLRTAALTIDVGPENPAHFGSVDLSTLKYGDGGDLDGLFFAVGIDGNSAVTVTFDEPSGPQDVADQINMALGANVAYLQGKNVLALMSPTPESSNGAVEVSSGSASPVLGVADNATVTTVADADDGLAEEYDDVQSTIENITAGTGNDSLFGGAARNVFKGGAGDDTLGGGASTSFDSALVADSLQGEAGNDTFILATYNKYVVVAGGLGSDAVSFGGRIDAVAISLDGLANDGESGENVGIGADVEHATGGFGNDTLNGSALDDRLNGSGGDDTINGNAGNDYLVGGPGDDIVNGGAGLDRIDYSDSSADLVVTLCVSAALTGEPGDCGSANDGDPLRESDQIANVEWVSGGSGNDQLYSSSGGSTLEGGLGNDTLTGGIGYDALWGDGGDDILLGGDGDDTLEGNSGDDKLIGGNGDGDICIHDAEDVTYPKVSCEL